MVSILEVLTHKGLALWKKCYCTNVTATAAQTLLGRSLSDTNCWWELCRCVLVTFPPTSAVKQVSSFFRGSRSYSCSDSTLCFITPPHNSAWLSLLLCFAYIMRYNGNQPSACSLCTFTAWWWISVIAKSNANVPVFLHPSSCDWQDPSTCWQFTELWLIVIEYGSLFFSKTLPVWLSGVL